MEVNWWYLGIVTFCTVIILVYLIWKNLRDEKEVFKSFYVDYKPEKHEADDDEI